MCRCFRLIMKRWWWWRETFSICASHSPFCRRSSTIHNLSPAVAEQHFMCDNIFVGRKTSFAIFTQKSDSNLNDLWLFHSSYMTHSQLNHNKIGIIAKYTLFSYILSLWVIRYIFSLFSFTFIHEAPSFITSVEQNRKWQKA